MEWIKVITELIKVFAWLLIVILVYRFRHRIAKFIENIKKIKAGNVEVEIETVSKLHELEEGLKGNELPKLQTDSDLPSLPFVDPKLAIAQGRIDVEREIFRLSWRILGLSKVTYWHTDRHIDELENTDIITHHFSENLRSFFDVANRVLHGTDVPADIVSRTAAIAGDLLATLRYKRLIYEARRDFEAHGLWHMRNKMPLEQQRYYLMSAVASQIPEFGYDYDIYRDALNLFNERQQSNHPDDPDSEIPLLTIEEFVEALEWRENELERIRRELPKVHWDDRNDVIRWQWPPEWGDLGWSCPVLRDRISQFSVEQEIMQTRASLERHRARILAQRK